MSEREEPEPVAVVADEDNPLRKLVACLNTRDPAARLGVARTLQLIGPEAVPELLAELEQPDNDVREAIIGALGMMGRSARAALPRLRELCADERLGPAARQAVAAIGRRWPELDWKKFGHALTPWVLSLLLFLSVLHEVAAWIGLFGDLEGLALQVALLWAFLGAVMGGYLGLNLPRPSLAREWAQYFATAGACAGAFCGRLVGTLVEPLARALGG